MMMKLNLEKAIRNGVEQAINDYELKIGMTLKQALEKQIPKKPIYLSRRYWGTVSSGRCPNCKAQVNGMTYRYCKHCGQALDWSEGE